MWESLLGSRERISSRANPSSKGTRKLGGVVVRVAEPEDTGGSGPTLLATGPSFSNCRGQGAWSLDLKKGYTG